MLYDLCMPSPAISNYIQDTSEMNILCNLSSVVDLFVDRLELSKLSDSSRFHAYYHNSRIHLFIFYLFINNLLIVFIDSGNATVPVPFWNCDLAFT